ncbi:MAG: hypothetical protein ACKOZT_08950 [Cyanobium sp.]
MAQAARRLPPRRLPRLLASIAAAAALQLPMGALAAPSVQLLLRPSQERFSSGDPIWWLEVRQGPRLLKRWAAATGQPSKQTADRFWTPGNGAPLPPGAYSVGDPEPWNADLWIGLEPLFETRRGGLGIHNCFPGVGCICLPIRPQLDQLAALIRQHGIRRLEVLQR